MKFCKDCKYLVTLKELPIGPKCNHPENFKLDLVTGERIYVIPTARAMRINNVGACGEPGYLFEPK